MPPSPLVSVALSTYNGERYLGEQMDSILAQDGVRIEVVAVDDASRDGTLAMLQRYAERDARVRVLRNAENLGASASFERSMSHCAGDYIAPADQDDIWSADKLAKLLAAIGGADLAYCDSAFMAGDGTPTGQRISSRMSMMSGHAPLRFVLRNSVSGHAALLRRDLLAIARPFPDGIYHDWWLALAAASRKGIVHLDEPLVRFRRHDDAVSKLGRGGLGASAGRHRFWLRQRHRLLEAYAGSALGGRAVAARWLAAFDLALQGGTRWPLMREIWRSRDALVDHGSAALEAMRVQLRFLRKLAAAEREQAT